MVLSQLYGIYENNASAATKGTEKQAMGKTDIIADEVTARQWQYLFYLHTRRGQNRTVTACAEHFEISRTGAIKVFDALCRKGLVLRDDDAVTLTRRALDGLRPLIEQRDEVEVFLKSIGHSDVRARNEAIKLICTLPADTITILTARFLAERVLGTPENRMSDNALATLPEGVYPIRDFTVYKAAGNGISMGNDGFRHPLMLVSARGVHGVELRARTIRRTLPSGEVVQGTLSRLKYLKDGAYTECAAFCERWNIPGSALTVTREDDSIVCRMDFLADAGPSCRMPANSEGYLVFTVNTQSERLHLRMEAEKSKTFVASKGKSKAGVEDRKKIVK
jgi:Mn-dependent DtxR family transcriptional regulator